MLTNKNKIEVGMKVKQIKEIGYEQFDRVGREFEVKEVKENVIMCANGNMGFGISRNEFFEYFEIILDNKELIIIEIVDGIKTIRKGKLTIVVLPDGSEGASKCLPEDIYNAQRGYDIAYLKADIKRDEKTIKEKRDRLRELSK